SGTQGVEPHLHPKKCVQEVVEPHALARTTSIQHLRQTLVDSDEHQRVQHRNYPPQRTLPDGDERAAEVFKTVARHPAVSWVGSPPIRLCPGYKPLQVIALLMLEHATACSCSQICSQWPQRRRGYALPVRLLRFAWPPSPNRASISSAAASCMVSKTCEHVPKVSVMLLCPSSSCTCLGWIPRAPKRVAVV